MLNSRLIEIVLMILYPEKENEHAIPGDLARALIGIEKERDSITRR